MKYAALAGIVLFALNAGAGLVPVAAPESPGQVKAYLVQGPVFVKNAEGALTEVTRSTVLAEGSTLVTGAHGNAMLVFSNGAVVQVKPETELRIVQFRQAPFNESAQGAFLRLKADPSQSATSLKIVKGRVEGEVKSLNAAAGSTFRLEMPDGTVRTDLPRSAAAPSFPSGR